jgi:hypothetical protein
MRRIFRKVAISYRLGRPGFKRCLPVGAEPVCRLACCLALLILAGCSGAKDTSPQNNVLIRSGPQTVTMAQFERAFSVARIAYSDDPSVKPQVLRNARLRLLHQMTEEVVVMRRAKELGIVLDDRELEDAIRKIQKDYPEGEFKEMLLESAVPYSLWKERLSVRLLMEKVVKRDLVPKLNITAQEIEKYYKEHEDEFSVDDDELPNADLKRRILERLRRQKEESAYPQWIDGLRKRYGVEINWSLWGKSQGPEANAKDRKKG